MFKRTFRVFFFIFFPYLCLHNLGLVRVEVGWVCLDVLFFISECHFLFLLIFILFSLARLYICVVGVFLYGVWLLAYLFCCFLSFLFPFCIYLLFMICDCTLSFFLWKWDYHILFVYWLIVYIVFLKIYRNIVCIIQWNYN